MAGQSTEIAAEMKLKPVGDRAVLLEFGNKIEEAVNCRVMSWEKRIRRANVPGINELVPAFTSLLVCYDPLVTDYREVSDAVKGLAAEQEPEERTTGKMVLIPVCYGGIYGEDLGFVAEHAGMTEDEVIRLHSGRDYRIYMLGFLPGFPYLGGMDERIAAPRLASPRTKIPAGSVGIGGEQTGIYPMESPGGWQLIGRTPLTLFDPGQEGNMLYEAGDILRFVPVTPEEYEAIRRDPAGWKVYPDGNGRQYGQSR